MTRILCFSALVVAAGVVAHAQQSSTVSRDAFGIAGTPSTPPPGWTLRASDTPTTLSPDAVRRFGPGVRITTTSPALFFRPAFPVSGDGSVSAVVFVDSATPAAFGLTLGGENGLAFLIQPVGAIAIAPLQDRQIGAVTWSAAPAAQLAATTDRRPYRLEVRVHGSAADFLLNGTVVTTTPIAAGALDGVPAVYSGGAGDLVVAGFTVRTAQRLTLGPAK